VHYYIVSALLSKAVLFLPSEQERVAWARHWLELSLQFYQSPQLRRADHYRAFDPFLGILDPSILVVGYDTDFSYQAGLWRERATKEVRIRELDERPRCSETFEVLYSPVPLQQLLPLDEPDYDFYKREAISNIGFARERLQQAGALPADDWLLIAGWQVWQLPKDKAFLRARNGELYLSLRALRQLRIRFVAEKDRVVLWNGSYRQAVLLDGRDGFREREEVWVRVLALKEKGLFEAVRWKGYGGVDIRMYMMYAPRPVDESGKQGEASDSGRQILWYSTTRWRVSPSAPLQAL
jgi:hypothetical protein